MPNSERELYDALKAVFTHPDFAWLFAGHPDLDAQASEALRAAEKRYDDEAQPEEEPEWLSS